MRERVAYPGRCGCNCIRAVQGHAGLVHLSAKLGQLVVYQRPQLDHLALSCCTPFPLHPELRAILVGPTLCFGELGSEHIHQLAQHHGFPARLYGCLYGRLNARLYGRTNGRGRLLAFRKLDQSSPVIPALVAPMQASRPLPGRFGRDAQPLAGLLVGQPLPCDMPLLYPFMLSGLSDRTYDRLYRLQTGSLGLGEARQGYTTGGRRRRQSLRLTPFLSALCSTPGPAGPVGASVWRDALRPDTLPTARRAAEGKGAAAWGAGTGPARSHAQRPLGGASMASTGRTHPLPAASTGALPRACARAYVRALRFLLGFKCSGHFF